MDDLFPPFAPDPNESRPRLFKPVPFRVIAPNLITLLALCLGLTAIRLAFEGRLEPAVIAIVVAAVLDGVDGRVARLLKGTSRFGAELDSLSDFLNFGCAPALVLYGFALHDLKSWGWTVSLIFAIAMALRLARFNAMIDDPQRPEWKKNFFVGMPAPAGALTALLPVYLSLRGYIDAGPSIAVAIAIALYTLGIALLMVSTVPTFSGKTTGKRVPRQWVLPIFVVTVAVFGVGISYPFEALALAGVVYLAAIPFGVAYHRRVARAEAAAPSGTSAGPAEDGVVREPEP